MIKRDVAQAQKARPEDQSIVSSTLSSYHVIPLCHRNLLRPSTVEAPLLRQRRLEAGTSSKVAELKSSRFIEAVEKSKSEEMMMHLPICTPNSSSAV